MEQSTSKEKLTKAIQLIKEGKKKEGGQILFEIVKSEPKNENAWLWLSTCSNNVDQKVNCLKKVLDINPDHDKAKSAYEKLINLNSEPDFDSIVGSINSNKEKNLSEMIKNKVDSSHSIEFIPAICPNCGGELRIPSDMKLVKCMYCGYDVIIHNSTTLNVNLKLKMNEDKTLQLAKIAEQGKNYKEGLKYYSQILEHNSENASAWFGKARCVAWTATAQNETIDEANSYVKIAIGYEGYDEKDLIFTVEQLSSAIVAFTNKVIDFLNQEYKRREEPSHIEPFHMAAANMANSRLSKELYEKMNTEYLPVIVENLQAWWKIDKSENIAKNIVKIISYINKPLGLPFGTSLLIDQNFSKMVDEIRQKYPNVIPQEENKKCFIATAVMGGIDHPYVETLRNFRDLILVKSIFGQTFNNIYYLASPFFAKIIERNEFLKRITKIILIKPLYKLAENSLRKQEYLPLEDK